MNGIIIQKGAFNPLHRMHLKIAEDAIKRFPTYLHTFVLSSITCDKGVIPEKELERRAKLIEAQNYGVVVTESGLFIDDINLIRNMDEDLEIVFAVGEDTIYRFFRDWEKYYTETYPNQYLKRFEDYDKTFQNVVWYVTRRNCPELNYLKQIVDSYCDNIIWSNLDLDNISSTKIREEVEEQIKKCIEQTIRLKD